MKDTEKYREIQRIHRNRLPRCDAILNNSIQYLINPISYLSCLSLSLERLQFSAPPTPVATSTNLFPLLHVRNGRKAQQYTCIFFFLCSYTQTYVGLFVLSGLFVFHS